MFKPRAGHSVFARPPGPASHFHKAEPEPPGACPHPDGGSVRRDPPLQKERLQPVAGHSCTSISGAALTRATPGGAEGPCFNLRPTIGVVSLHLTDGMWGPQRPAMSPN